MRGLVSTKYTIRIQRNDRSRREQLCMAAVQAGLAYHEPPDSWPALAPLRKAEKEAVKRTVAEIITKHKIEVKSS